MCVASKLMKAGAPVGNRTRAKVVKNKMAPPFKQVEFDIVYGKAFRAKARSLTWVSKPASCASPAPGSLYWDDQLGQGGECAPVPVDNPELANEIEQKILITPRHCRGTGAGEGEGGPRRHPG